MVHRISLSCAARLLLASATGLLLAELQLPAQIPPDAPATNAPPAWARDFTGYWVSVITQNWRLRMVTPPKGDYMGIPLTPAAKTIADAWDPAKDEAGGNQCKSYGAATVMTNPERLHITWPDDKSLNMEIDNGTQTRVFHFGAGAPRSAKPSWQGDSSAAWVPRRSQGYRAPPNSQYLQVTTTNMLPGYLRKNGIPYSDKAALTEDYDMIHERDGATWLIVTTIVTDPVYLDYPLMLTAEFKKQPDASGWEPTPCSAKW